MTKGSHDSSLTGAAGEHYVLFELLRRGFIAALAPKGVPNADIVVTDTAGHKLCAIQVKTRSRGNEKGWLMGEKHESLISPSLFYCFLDIENLPFTYVVPSNVVAEIITEYHRHWLEKPGKKGKAHNPTKMRTILVDYTKRGFTKYPADWMNQYKEKWELLRLASDVRPR